MNLLTRYLETVRRRNLIPPDALDAFTKVLRTAWWTLAAIFAVLYVTIGPLAKGLKNPGFWPGTLWWIFLYCLWTVGYTALLTLIFALAHRHGTRRMLKQYLDAVRSYLPADQQDDILQELSANIASEIEEREGELRRPLREGELQAILKRHGDPMLVAGRYLPRQHLIGPAVFPFYWFTLKASLWITLLVWVVGAASVPFIAGIVEITGKPVSPTLLHPGIALSIFGGLMALCTVFGLVTAIFWMIETCFAGALARRWSLTPAPGAEPKLKPRTEAVITLVLAVAGIVCWLTIPDFPWVIGRAARFVRPAPVWQSFRLGALLLMAAAVLESCVHIMRPQWKRLIGGVRVARHAAGVVFVLFAMRFSDSLIVLQLPDVPPAKAEMIARILNECVYYGLLLALLMTLVTHAVKAVPYLRRWLRGRRMAAPIGSY